MSLRTTGQSLSVDPYCAPEDKDSLSSQLIPKCWEKKSPLDEAKVSSEAQLLKNDHEICQCLRDPNRTKLESIRQLMMAGSIILQDEDSEENRIEIFKDNVRALQVELKQQRDGLGFSAYAMSQDTKFTNAYLQPSTATSDIAHTAPLTSCLNGVCKLDGGRHNQVDDQDKEIQKIISKFNVPENVDDALFKDKVFHPDQCISAREYLAFTQLPSDNLLKEKIKKTSLDSFDENGWNHFELLNQYDQQMSLSDQKKNKNKIMELKAKLIFLNRNPMIKTLLAADTDMSLVEKNKNISGDKKREIQRKFSSLNGSLPSMKKELLKILKEFVKNKNSMSGVSDYQKKLKRFFVKPVVGELIEIEFEKQEYKKMSMIKDPENFRPRNNLSHKSVVDRFIAKTGLGNPNDCNSEKLEIMDCVNIYSRYCKVLDKSMVQVSRAERNPAFVDDLRESTMNDFNPDFNTNSDFKRYNNLICGMKRSKSSNKNDSIDFFTYKYRKCRLRITGDCDNSPESLIALRKKFVKEYDQINSLNKGLSNIENLDDFLANQDLKPIKDVKVPSKTDFRKRLGKGFALIDIADSWGIPSQESVVSTNVVKADPNESPSNRASLDNGAVEREFYNYQNTTPLAAKGQSTDFNGDKIEKMTETGRKNLLNEWETQYDDWKKSKGTGDLLNPKDSTTDAALRSEISTLKALLAQQQQLSQEQYQLLNNAITSKKMKSISETDAQAKPPVKRSSSENSTPIFGSPSKDSLQDSSRTPANFKEAQAASVGSGTVPLPTRKFSFKPSIGSANASADSSPDSVIREQSKLINLRQFSDGSIQINSVPKAENGGANAISLDVSDNEYQDLQDKKSELKLDQIKKRISQDHIDKVEKNGEITILLRNGNRPPFELKVQKKDNKLVYSLKDKNGNDQDPIKRVHTRKALVLGVRPE